MNSFGDHALPNFCTGRSLPTMRVSGGKHPPTSATRARTECDVRRPVVIRTTQGVQPRFDRGVTLVGHDQPRLIEEVLRRAALAYALLVDAVAGVSNIQLKVLGMLKIDHRSQKTRVYTRAKPIQGAP
jgi:hypothetical protein